MRIVLKNRMDVLLRQKGIRSAAEFARRLNAQEHYVLSPSQATRYFRETAPSFDIRFVEATCNLLQCLPSDLYEIRIDLDADEELDPTLAVPRHATILRTTAGDKKVADAKPPKAERADENAPNKKAVKKAETSVHTGPSPSIFPFRKK